MPDHVKNKLRELGVVALSTWHLVMLIISMIMGIGFSYGLAVNRIDSLEIRANKLEEQMKLVHKTEIDISRIEAKLDFLINSVKENK